MSHDVTLPPIPFTDADQVVMRKDDVQAGKYIACLCSGIFMMGLCIYITVLVATLLTPPVYAIR